MSIAEGPSDTLEALQVRYRQAQNEKHVTWRPFSPLGP